MTWEEAISTIQSPEFGAELNVVSGTPAFFRAVRSTPAVRQSLNLMKESGDLREEVLGHLHDLSALELDPRYENPHDVALAVFLWLTHYTDPDFARLGAQYVERAPRCWYAIKLARQITHPPVPESSDFRINVNTDGYASIANTSGTESLNMISPAEKVRVIAGPSSGIAFQTQSSEDAQESGFESYLGSH